jgi:antiviral helicase SKI2
MAEGLVGAIERLYLGGGSGHNEPIESDLESVDDILYRQSQHKRVGLQHVGLREELETRFLDPSPSFSLEWLNRLQQ